MRWAANRIESLAFELGRIGTSDEAIMRRVRRLGRVACALRLAALNAVSP